MRWKYQLSDIDYGREEQQAVLGVLKSKWLSMGEQTRRFEEEVGRYVGARSVAVSSCTAALHLALKAVDIGPGDEVIVPSYTFIATVNSINYQGATPVFVDINGPHDLNMDTSKLENLLTERTRAIMPVHIAGYATNIEEVVRFARDHGLWVIEDAAHALGSSHAGKALGTFGDVGCYSFFANKNLVTGEGGMLVTNNKDIFERASVLRSQGIPTTSLDKASGSSPEYDVYELGHNYRMTELHAALGICQLSKLEQNNRKRRQLTQRYRENLYGEPYATVPFLSNQTHSSCHIFPVILSADLDRGEVIKNLKEQGVQTSIHCPPLHKFSLYSKKIDVSLPKTEDVSKREITLPLHPLLEEKDIDGICLILKNVVKHLKK